MSRVPSIRGTTLSADSSTRGSRLSSSGLRLNGGRGDERVAASHQAPKLRDSREDSAEMPPLRSAASLAARSEKTEGRLVMGLPF